MGFNNHLITISVGKGGTGNQVLSRTVEGHKTLLLSNYFQITQKEPIKHIRYPERWALTIYYNPHIIKLTLADF